MESFSSLFFLELPHYYVFFLILRFLWVGTLEGFTFESDDEADKMTKDVKGDQSEGAEEKPTKKAKGKAEKKPVCTGFFSLSQ